MLPERQGFTVIAELEPARVPALRDLLAEVQRDPGENHHVGFARTGLTHFACFVILDHDPDYSPLLVFDVSHDGERRAYMERLVALSGAGLAAIFAACTDWRPGADLVEFMLAHARPAAGAHLGYPGRSVRGLANDRAVRARLRAILDTPEGRAAMREAGRPGQARRALLAALRQENSSGPPLTTAPSPVWPGWAKLRFLAEVPIGLLHIVALFGLTLLLRRQERRDAEEEYDGPLRPLPDPTREVVEDRYPQNHLTHLVRIRPGWRRRAALRLVLSGVDRLSRVHFTRGDLGGIPTIHFARWLILDEGPEPRLLFLSNYDLSWDSYLGDFIDRAAGGLTGVWSHTRGFPPARWLIGDGARYDEAFKAWTRQHQLPEQVWYTSRPDQSVAQVQNACAVRDGLERDLSTREGRRWLVRV